jgi:CNT family concentrative nucleoside transporter
MALHIGAMLIAFVSLTHLLDSLIAWGFSLIGLSVSLQKLLSFVFQPVVWLLGIYGDQGHIAAELLGQKIILNEFIAYTHLQEVKSALSPHALGVINVALCGFANLSSIGIQLGGIGSLAPERKHDLARLGMRALWGGALTSLWSASWVSVLGVF